MGINRKNDYAFKRIFGHQDTKDILAKFLSDVMEQTITPDELTLVNTELSPEYLEDKSAILDIQVRRTIKNGVEKYDVEFQNTGEADIIRRILSYMSRSFISDMKSGDDYDKLPRVVSIVIADFDMVKVNKVKFHSVFELREREDGYRLDDTFAVHVLELPKLISLKHLREELLGWETAGNAGGDSHPRLRQIKPDERWGIYLDNTEGKIMELIAEQEPMIARALSVEEIFAMDAEERFRYEMREKSLAHLRGVRKASFEAGFETGEKAKAVAIARKMLKQNRAIEEIIDYTDLRRDEIEKLRS